MLARCCLRRSFFVKGRKFRQPAYLATSFSEAVARQFLAMRGGSDCVLWRVRSVPSSFCFSLPQPVRAIATTRSCCSDGPDSSVLAMAVLWSGAYRC